MAKILPDVHYYWVAKRTAQGKLNSSQGRALCRKYWTQTSSSDTNPHHTFRPRDKEKYRLRRQQKRNDLEAFRKLQQIRREFGQARCLTQLVIEREKCGEAELELQTQIFEQTLFDGGLHQLLGIGQGAGTDTGPAVPPGRRCAKTYTHSLAYEHLLFAAVASTAPRRPLPLPVPRDTTKSGLPPLSRKMKTSLTGQAGAAAAAAAAEGLDSKKLKGLKKLGLQLPKQFKRKRNAEGQLVDAPEDAPAAPPVAAAEPAPESAVKSPPLPLLFESSDEYLTSVSGLYGSGPPNSCFPSFMEPSEMRGAALCDRQCTVGGGASMSAYLSRYMTDLQLRYSYSYSDSYNDCCEQGAESGLGGMGLSVHYPDGYKYRPRVGRGGRLILDRVPVYHPHTRGDDVEGNPEGEDEEDGDAGAARVVYGSVVPLGKAGRALGSDSLSVPVNPMPRFAVNRAPSAPAMPGGGVGGGDLNNHHLQYFSAPARALVTQFQSKASEVYAYPHVDNERVLYSHGADGRGRDGGLGLGLALSRDCNRLLRTEGTASASAPTPVPVGEMTLQYTLSV